MLLRRIVNRQEEMLFPESPAEHVPMMVPHEQLIAAHKEPPTATLVKKALLQSWLRARGTFLQGGDPERSIACGARDLEMLSPKWGTLL